MVIVQMNGTSESPPAVSGTALKVAPVPVVVSHVAHPLGAGEPLEGASTPGSAASSRNKLHVTCSDEALTKEHMSSEELSKFCFPKTVDLQVSTAALTTDCSSGSSACSRDSEWGPNSKVLAREVSRTGRLTQRWETDPVTQQVLRLVTGCVPILSDGRILLVSSRQKPEWILPKGGWESDESMQESAIRESYEEAGILGTLGPALSPIQYETRKARKRRLEQEELHRKQGRIESTLHMSKDEQHGSTADTGSNIVAGGTRSPPVQTPDGAETTMSAEAMARIRDSIPKPCDETASVASDATGQYSLVRLTLMPIYVTEVKETWPENGRCRMAVSIDDAILKMKSRPEFQAALIEVKEKGLHFVKGAQPMEGNGKTEKRAS